MRLLKEGVPYVAACGLAAAITYKFNRFLSLAFLGLGSFCALFFRDPERDLPPDSNFVYAAADGTILDVEEIKDNIFMDTPAIRVATFLSVTNVHINRAPVRGRITLLKHVQGKFNAAMKKEAIENERNYIGLETPYGRVLVVQIAGLVARRIVMWTGIGDDVVLGQKLGMIKFGSRTDVYLPKLSVDILVKKGEYVEAGKSIIAQFHKK